jgi:hypothetical protein
MIRHTSVPTAPLILVAIAICNIPNCLFAEVPEDKKGIQLESSTPPVELKSKIEQALIKGEIFGTFSTCSGLKDVYVNVLRLQTCIRLRRLKRRKRKWNSLRGRDSKS